ncbi:MAG: carboxypeptidase-like regulatory domain-containing protein [Acidobacteriota bacterium]|nr:carboxypeptidase-like regulatory domain-containing protein [Acidobacteriota bacterium]
MRRFLKLPLFIILIIGALINCSCNSFGDPIIKIKGLVRDTQSTPIESATVQLEREKNGEIRKLDLDQLTKADGSFEFTIIGSLPDNLKLIVRKDGFKTVENRILESEGQKEMDITLERESK